jgi:HK97 family phage major capsid protein
MTEEIRSVQDEANKLLHVMGEKMAESKKYTDSVVSENIQKLSSDISELVIRAGKLDERMGRVETEGSLSVKREKSRDEVMAESRKAFAGKLKQAMSEQKVVTITNEKMDYSGASASTGGVFVNPIYAEQIVGEQAVISQIRANASVAKITGNIIKFPEKIGFVSVSQSYEGNDPFPTSTTSTFNTVEIQSEKTVGLAKVTKEMVTQANNSAFDVLTFVRNEFATRLATHENQLFITGRGHATYYEPRGILAGGYTFQEGSAYTAYAHDTIQTIPSGVSGNFSIEGLADLIYSLKSVYRPNAKLYLSNKALGEITKLNSANNYHFDFLSSLLIGREGLAPVAPVVVIDEIPAPVAAGYCAIYGDLTNYQIVDSDEMEIVINPYKSNAFLEITLTKYTGGGLLNSEAVKVQVLKVAS